MLASRFVRGTGVDLFYDDEGRLAEERPLVGGQRSGIERWWNPDQTTAYEETAFFSGLPHGVARQWRDGRLRPGFPHFLVHGQRVTKRSYLRAARVDPTLAPYRRDDDQPARRLPDAYLAARQTSRRR